RVTVPCAEPGIADGFAGAVQNIETPRCSVLVKSEREQRRGFERRSLCLFLRSRHLARLRDFGRFRRAGPLLPPARSAAGEATVARDRLAQTIARCDMPPPLLLLQEISLSFGATPLLSGAALAPSLVHQTCWCSTSRLTISIWKRSIYCKRS